MKSVHEQLRENFERWEIRGRGVLTYPKPVSPRPPFAPFRGHRVPQLLSGVDSVRPTRVSSFLQRAKALVKGENNAAPAVATLQDDGKEQDIEPEWCLRLPCWIEIPMRLPQEMNVSREAMSPLLTSLAYVSHPLVFEIVGTAEKTWMQWVVSENDEAQLRQQMQAHFPQAKLSKPTDTLAEMLQDTDEMAVVEFGLGEVFMLPLASVKNDPFVTLVGALASLAEGEIGLYQVIFVPLSEPWAESSLAAITKQDGQPFFDDGGPMVKAAQQKTCGMLYGVVVRLAAAGSSYERAWRIVSGMAPALRHFSLTNGNHFMPLHNHDYDPKDHLMDVVSRQTCRCGMVLSIDELTGLVHLPTATVQSAKFHRLDTGTRAADTPPRHQGVCLGINQHNGEATEVWLPPAHRVRHCHILGGTGTGKSTLLFSMIQQDILRGEGVAVLDPHGDLIDRVLGIIPPERVKDVVLLDPADEQFVIPFNILSAHSDFEKQLLASDLVSVFQRLSTSWGDQMNSVFQNAVLAFLESRDGGTLADLRRFLLDAQWREQFLETVSDPDVRFYWKRAFPQLGSGKSIGPIITRLETFLSPKPIRYMVSQRENRLDFRAMMDGGKIFLARLPQGLIGRENAFLLGSLIMTKLQQMAMSRARIPESQRRPFYCYIDEFHHFITPSLTEVLSGARKYGLGLVLAHQELKQLDRDKDVGSAVLSNAFTRVVFRVGDSDARALADGFAHFEARDIQSLATGHAIARIERADHDFNLAVPRPEELNEAKTEQVRSAVIDASRQTYSITRQQVESELLRRLEEEAAKPQSPKQRKAREDGVIVPAVLPPEPPQPPRLIEPPPEAPVRVPTNTAHEPPLPPPTPTPAVAADPGKGGHQHRIVQDRIRTVSEQMGFRAHLEMPVGAGRETVDVGLLRHDMRIACEISVTTTIDHEVGNVRKCLREDFNLVAVITADARRLRQIESAVSGCFENGEASKVRYFQPEAFITYLATLTPPPEPEQIPTAPAPKESVRKGYKVKRVFTHLTQEERSAREAAALKLLAEELKPRPMKEQ
ncbi:type IV secretory system conjugative DNA transfer family protein [Prosthecobacter sp.]|uniref:type IV secretory system conjugative DNA transfer family protein n=1 Tax=Prosthecobacter sp. TaxID=1965333 RepID=UPI0037850182